MQLFPSIIRRRGFARSLAPMMLAGTLSGCMSLPTSGPTANQVLRAEKDEVGKLGVQIVEVDSAAITAIKAAAVSTTGRLAALDVPGGAVDTVGPGDVLQISIFEVGTGLFSRRTVAAEEAFDPGAGSSSLGNVVVDREGAITLPYVGRLEVAGMAPAEIQGAIERGLAGLSQNPQALVSVKQNVSNTVVVAGDVLKPGRQPLSLAHERLLDAVAAAGGTGQVSQNMVVRFTRRGRTIEQPLYTIVSGSSDDLPLLPGDRIELIRQPRSYTVFGATGRVSQIPFDTSELSLAEAVARAGGPSDAAADASAVFVFRYAPPATMPSRVETSASLIQDARMPIIYRLNLMKPSSYFLAQRFSMQDKDLIYVANARANQPTKLAQIINLLFSPIFTVRAATR
jgi:polysaccharide biosynthesis/export protein